MNRIVKALGVAGAALISACAYANNGVVSSPNCNFAGFVNVFDAVEGSNGGTITFSCGNAPVTITFTSYLQVSDNIVIDGANKVTFDGGGGSAFFQVFGSDGLTLERLTLQNGAYNASHALENFGTLTLTSVTVKNNSSLDTPVYNEGTLIVSSSTFSSNNGQSGKGGAINNESGTMSVAQTTFSNNQASQGGAINVDSGQATITGSTFSGNQSSQGGAIANADTLIVSTSTFSGNQTDGNGGAILASDGATTINRSQFVNNDAQGDGAGVACLGGSLSVTNSAFGGNQATSNGGGIYNVCDMNVVNATFNTNSGTSGGGAIYQNGSQPGSVSYATIASNSGSFGAGLYNGGSGELVVSKSIITSNTTGNCDGVITSGGYNLANDGGCGGAFIGTDKGNATLTLGSFTNNGGSTSTMLPKTGNEAINFIPVGQCGNARDQRGYDRPSGTGCDSGAVELNGANDGIFADGFGY